MYDVGGMFERVESKWNKCSRRAIARGDTCTANVLAEILDLYRVLDAAICACRASEE